MFLLGLQRSGSTWLTNIFDAHERSWVFMEPFAPDYGIFPEFPETNFFLDESSPGLERVLRELMPKRLVHFKKLLSQRSVENARWFRAERSLVKLALSRRRWLPASVVGRVRKTELLNLNRMDESAPLVDKVARPDAWVIKELRLAGKVRLLNHAFPEARFVALVRHPCANVQAIASWFERGRLRELRKDLDTFVPKISAQRVGERYGDQLAACRSGSELHRIALYWRVHNEALVDALVGLPNALIVTYEELASAPLPTVSRILDFCGLPSSEAVVRYVRESSTTPLTGGGLITTLRDSATHYRAWEKKVSTELREATQLMVADSPLMSRFAPFYGAPA